MTPIIENAILSTDLDGRFNDLLNIGELIPVPLNLATSDNPALSDSRTPLPGTVTDASVAPGAAIVQSKLSLNGVIPTAWLGTSSNQAARGDLAEYVANKNQPNGYAGLDGSGKIPNANLPGTTGTGTVTSVGLAMPAAFTVSGSPVISAGVISVGWAAVTDLSWFGRNAGSSGAPQFYTTPLPPSLIPALDASIVTSGVFGAALLPVAIGLGVTHAPGAVPDPGDGTVGLASDYLARDMTFKGVPLIGPPFQPIIPNPTFVAGVGPGYPVAWSILSSVPGATIFYSLTSGTSGFSELPDSGFVSVPVAGTLYAYAAHAGYNNSAVVSTPV